MTNYKTLYVNPSSGMKRTGLELDGSGAGYVPAHWTALREFGGTPFGDPAGYRVGAWEPVYMRAGLARPWRIARELQDTSRENGDPQSAIDGAWWENGRGMQWGRTATGRARTFATREQAQRAADKATQASRFGKSAQHVVMYGRRWFEATNGNTYHAVIVFVDGTEIYRDARMVYGYGDQWEHRAFAAYLHSVNEIYYGVPWRYAETTGVQFIREVTDVKRKRDLLAFG